MPEYQLCPKCNGQGIVNRPPYVAGDVTEWVDNVSAYTCNLCDGTMVIPKPSPGELESMLGIQYIYGDY